jgi:hypothetical protein
MQPAFQVVEQRFRPGLPHQSSFVRDDLPRISVSITYSSAIRRNASAVNAAGLASCRSYGFRQKAQRALRRQV